MELYPRASKEELLGWLSDRSWKSIQHRAANLGAETRAGAWARRMSVAPPDTQLAYYAGFFDGEGSVGVYIGKQGHHSIVNKAYRLSVTVSNNDPSVIMQLFTDFGGTVRTVANQWQGKRTADMHIWAAQGKTAEAFLIAVLPYLRVKRQQAEVALEYQQLVNTVRGRRLGMARILDRGREYSEKLKEMKMVYRGGVPN